MTKLLVIGLLCLPLSASAEHMDVLQLKLDEDCSVADYSAIVQDFNEQWGMAHGYRAELAVPLQNDDLSSIFWLGRSANAAAFGKAWDVWRDAQANRKSLEYKLQARFNECGTVESRSGFDLY